MTEAPPTPTEEPASGPEPERVLSRAGEGRMLTGVCAGLGRYSGMDPVLFRVGFAVLVLGSGIGIMLYIAAFLLMREPDGRPGYLEQWTRRIFDTDTVLALLAAVFAFGLIINLAAGGIGTGTVVVGTLLAIALLAAHSRGVDLLAVAKSLPELLTGRRGMTQASDAAFARPRPFSSPPPGGYGTPQGPPPTRPGGYRRLSDLAREARSSTYAGPTGYSSSEPFAPHGPYGPHTAYSRHGTYSPPSPYGSTYGRQPYPPEEPPPPRTKQKQPKSFIGGLTICLALIVGGVMVSVQQSSTGSVGVPVIGGAVLITIGAGLLVATWFGRGAALVATGTIVSLILVAGSTMNGIPKKIGSYAWHPVNTTQAAKNYTVGIGEGKLDLSDFALAPGARARFSASVSMGQITVIVPATARIEVYGYTRLGEVKIDHKVEDGADVQFDRVLEPEVTGTGDVATIELHVKAGLGDVDVRRAA